MKKSSELTVFYMVGGIFTGIGILFTLIGVIVAVGSGRSFLWSGGLFFLLIFGGIGILFAVIGICFLIYASKQKKKKMLRLQNGHKIWATIEEWSVNRNVSMNGSHPIRLDCKYEDPYSGEVYLYRSGDFWGRRPDLVGLSIAVFVDPQDPQNYYVDTESIPPISGTTGAQVHDFR